MNKFLWGNAEKNLKTVLDRPRVQRLEQIFKECASDWEISVDQMRQDIANKLPLDASFQKFANNTAKKLRIATGIYEGVLGKATARQLGYNSRDDLPEIRETNALDRNKPAVRVFNAYKPWQMPPRDRHALGVAHEAFRFLSYKCGKDRMDVTQKIHGTNVLVKELVDHIVPMLNGAENETDREEAVLSEFVQRPKLSTTTPASDQATAENGRQPPAADIAGQLRDVRGSNPNIGGQEPKKGGIRGMFSMTRA